MFPNFRNTADRIQKEQDLLSKVERRNRQNTIKRNLYAEALWAADAGKVVKAPQSSDTTQSILSMNEGVIHAKSDEENSAVQPPDITPSTTLSLDLNAPTTSNASHELIKEWFHSHPELINLRISPVRKDGSIEERYVLGVDGYLYSVRSGRKVRPQNIDWVATRNQVMDTSNEQTQTQTNNTIDWIRNWYIAHPEWVSMKVRPINRVGTTSKKYYFGTNGVLFDLRTGERAQDIDYDSPEAIDWAATANHIKHIYSDGESNSIDELAMMRMPVPSLSYDETQALLDAATDQEDTRDWVTQWMSEHPDQEIQPVVSHTRPDDIDWVATQETILSRSSSGLTMEELLNRLDEQAQAFMSAEPAFVEVVDHTATELRQADLESELSDTSTSPTPDEQRRRRRHRIQIEGAVERLREARAAKSRAKRNEFVQQTRRELTQLLNEMRENLIMRANDFDVPNPPTRSRFTRKQWLQRSLRQALTKISARGFGTLNRSERLKTLETAISCLRELKDDMPSDVYRSHYQVISRAFSRQSATAMTGRRDRNTSRTEELLMGAPTPSLPS
ncbi:hypothetical protein PHYSODRAFT_307853 [Phytophthora sojae]|uniref:Uncharacterized protein n=1 Tax=Phytophthora sojae (strain P6497) TaxID=1094619 RepID=G5AGI5_PHYSP|nr:hypothetical protein PHYSODRAFT_307853 [Phytophthora sojae]EGZ05265.1 hypothetical protein PHYSODRAFT_307853 [Phytophthora sojae]|eukprot:XP_009539186.1 hypothetical protein PHYSODRAFT_307853 [Phytophthora sojae]